LLSTGERKRNKSEEKSIKTGGYLIEIPSSLLAEKKVGCPCEGESSRNGREGNRLSDLSTICLGTRGKSKKVTFGGKTEQDICQRKGKMQFDATMNACDRGEGSSHTLMNWTGPSATSARLHQ